MNWFANGRMVCRPLSIDELRTIDSELSGRIDVARKALADLLAQQAQLWEAAAGVRKGDVVATRFGILPVVQVETSYSEAIGHKPAVRVTHPDGSLILLHPADWSMIGDQ